MKIPKLNLWVKRIYDLKLWSKELLFIIQQAIKKSVLHAWHPVSSTEYLKSQKDQSVKANISDSYVYPHLFDFHVLDVRFYFNFFLEKVSAITFVQKYCTVLCTRSLPPTLKIILDNIVGIVKLSKIIVFVLSITESWTRDNSGSQTSEMTLKKLSRRHENWTESNLFEKSEI